MLIVVIFVLALFYNSAVSLKKISHNASDFSLLDHSIVSSSNVFPYVAAIMNKYRYLCAGALIDESWVLTVADSVLIFRDSLRLLRVRLGSVNNKSGGKLVPIKLIEFHPYFDDKRPEYDIALVKLAKKVKLTPNLNPIRMQRRPKAVMAMHFIVTSWPMQRVSLADSTHRKRMLQVAHLHPIKPQHCSDALDALGFSKANLMCLEPGIGSDPCSREIGAPVVLNGILWGLVSSWVPDDCDVVPTPSFVVLVSAPNASSWIHATMRSNKWHQWTIFDTDYEDYDFDDID